jgi:response regulator RpfG family c-di-GMP phosphodiesterase
VQMGASIAHEFNNPIQGVRNILEIFCESSNSEKNKRLGKIGISECDLLSKLFLGIMDLVITDLMMCSLIAIDIIKKVRKFNLLIGTIIITGIHDSPLLGEAIVLHPSVHLFKPFSSEELVKKVHKCIEGC